MNERISFFYLLLAWMRISFVLLKPCVDCRAYVLLASVKLASIDTSYEVNLHEIYLSLFSNYHTL